MDDDGLASLLNSKGKAGESSGAPGGGGGGGEGKSREKKKVTFEFTRNFSRVSNYGNQAKVGNLRLLIPCRDF